MQCNTSPFLRMTLGYVAKRRQLSSHAGCMYINTVGPKAKKGKSSIFLGILATAYVWETWAPPVRLSPCCYGVNKRTASSSKGSALYSMTHLKLKQNSSYCKAHHLPLRLTAVGSSVVAQKTSHRYSASTNHALMGQVRVCIMQSICLSILL